MPCGMYVAMIEESGRKDINIAQPPTGTFIALLITLWALNFADIFQTLYLKESGFLAQEANNFIAFFLNSGVVQFFGAKVLALILVTSVLSRGWFDRRGMKFGGKHYSPLNVRQSISVLLVGGVIYYTLIVLLPFILLSISGLFAPIE